MFVTAPTRAEDFFKNGLPCDTFGHDIIYFGKDSAGFFNGADVGIINDHFNKKSQMKRNFKKWYSPKNGVRCLMRTICLTPWYDFSGFYYQHTPSGFLKSTFERLWEEEYDVLDKTCTDKFRSIGNVNQWLMKYWQLAEGSFEVREDSFSYCYHVKEHNYNDLLNDIPSRKHHMLCINDTAKTLDFEEKKLGVISAFEKLLPDKSEFEL